MTRFVRRENGGFLGLFGVVFCLAGALGYWTGGSTGVVIAALAIVVGILVLGVLLLGLSAVWRFPAIQWWSVLVSAGFVFGVFAIAQYGPVSGLEGSTELLVLASSTVAIGVGVGYVGGEDRASGIVHAVLAGGVAGLLYVLIATHQSFSMRPVLYMIVLLSGIVAPLAFAILCGLGGAVGGTLTSSNPDSA